MDCTVELQALRSRLLDLGQGHLFFSSRDDGSVVLEEPLPTQLQNERLRELAAFEYPGGICQYISTAKQLLTAAQSGESHEYAAIGQPPLVFRPPSLTASTPELLQLEAEGRAILGRTVFVLVAGGLGERLGYSGIKVGLPVETASGVTFLEHYLESFVLWRLQQSPTGGGDDGTSAADRFPSFVIMTSDDTHHRTVELLQHLLAARSSSSHAMASLVLGTDVVCVKQETVFCLSDNTARIAVDPITGRMLRKPHGHGDVHALLHRATISVAAGGTTDNGVAAPSDGDRPQAITGDTQRLMDVWRRAAVQYVVFCQDTNATSTWTAPITLAMCERERLDMGFTCVPRIPQEAVGLLCHVQQPAASPDAATAQPFQTVNVEYNKFDPIYRALYGQGDVAAGPTTPYSPFPGSINTLVLRFQPYAASIEASHGAVPEFINPKYKDSRQKTAFKAPTRVESLMQDVALLLDPRQHRVGGIVFDRQLYHPVKNSVAEALAKLAVGGDAHCAATGEANMYLLQRLRLNAIGVSVRDADADEEVQPPPRIPVNPAAATPTASPASVASIQLFPIVSLGNHVHAHCAMSSLLLAFPTPQHVSISGRSALVIRGRVVVESLTLDGALVVEGPEDDDVPPLRITNAVVTNKGWRVVVQSATSSTVGGDGDCWTEVDAMRGYRILRLETAQMRWDVAVAAAAAAAPYGHSTPPLVAPTNATSSTPAGVAQHLQQQAKM